MNNINPNPKVSRLLRRLLAATLALCATAPVLGTSRPVSAAQAPGQVAATGATAAFDNVLVRVTKVHRRGEYPLTVQVLDKALPDVEFAANKAGLVEKFLRSPRPLDGVVVRYDTDLQRTDPAGAAGARRIATGDLLRISGYVSEVENPTSECRFVLYVKVCTDGARPAAPVLIVTELGTPVGRCATSGTVSRPRKHKWDDADPWRLVLRLDRGGATTTTAGTAHLFLSPTRPGRSIKYTDYASVRLTLDGFSPVPVQRVEPGKVASVGVTATQPFSARVNAKISLRVDWYDDGRGLVPVRLKTLRV